MYEYYAALRDERHVRDADVAKHTGIGRSTFTDWKAGRSEPKREKLEKIADYFGVPVDYFYTGETPRYYMNDESAALAQEIFENPDLRILFDASKDISPEDMKFLIDMAKRMKATNPDG